ncbi:MAG TPA: ATP-binding protein [Candidatus Polarisedimenticolaceae bacterium]|nr:ATP-binding protein [Candidatus Polarisedimenticolaceae bacterium]
MQSGEDPASFWTRLFRCATPESAEAAIAAGPVDGDLARVAWRAHRASAERADARMEARARDVESLQAFGRALAESRDVVELFDAAAAGAQQLLEADAVAIAYDLPDRAGMEIHAGRPLAPGDEHRLRETVALGFVPLGDDAPPARRLPASDVLQGPRPPIAEGEIVIVPVERRGRELLRLAVVPRLGPSERGLRLLFGAANHLAVHLDRVLAVAEAEQGRFRAILDSMPHAVVLTDGAFQIVQANASAERLLPRLGSDAAFALRSAGDLDLVALAYDVLAGRRPYAEAEAALPDGIRLAVSVAPWRGGAGADGLVVVMLDVTVASRLREQVAQSEKLSSLGRMIAGVTHELNNPLTSVIGYAQLLRSMPPGEKMIARLDTIRRESERCRRIVQSLLRFARAHVPERRPFSLNEAVSNVSQLLAYPVRSAGCRLQLELDRELPALVGDAHELEQVLINLITNAHQAMTEAASPGAVTVRTFHDATSIGVEVSDEGPGIPETARARLFDPFFTTKPTGQGTGLGLWLVYNAVSAHGGSIDVGQTERGGARFRLAFRREAGIALHAAESEAGPDAPASVSARILVVDAEAALAALICEALAAEGHHAVAAHDADEAFARIACEPFDLLVSDAAVPGMSGERLAREVERVRPELRERILLTTSDWTSREPETAARALGAGLLRKPFELDELRRVVRTRLHRSAEP